MTGWDRLDPQFKLANRGQAEDIGRKLHAVGCVLAPRSSREPGAVFSAPEVEYLAELEHQRWVAEKLAARWRPGPRDDRARRREDLVPWAVLPDVVRERNRDAIRELPSILSDAGFQIVRLSDTGPTSAHRPDSDEP